VPEIEMFNKLSVTDYLRVSGWQPERVGDRRSIWQNRSGARVFIPESDGPDTAGLLALAVREIAQAEQRDLDEISIDLTWRQFDKLHVRREAPGSALVLQDALDFHSALSDVIVAGARAASEPKQSYSGRRPGAVDDYLEQVRMIPSIHGSFVVRALLPLTPPPEQATFDFAGPPSNDVRKISTTILRASRIAVETALAVVDGAPLATWEQSVPEGVSANLCDALGRLPGPLSQNVDLRIDWTWSEPTEPTPPVAVAGGLAPVLLAGGDFLRGEPEEHSILVTGLVTKLHRDLATGPGEVTVRGYIDGWDVATRSIRCELDERSYREAIHAHDVGASVRLRALVRRAQRGLEVIRVEDIEVLSN
jgi:hypothetical protein